MQELHRYTPQKRLEQELQMKEAVDSGRGYPLQRAVLFHPAGPDSRREAGSLYRQGAI